MPKAYIEELREAAMAGGYGSPCQLARCVIVRFLDFRRRSGKEQDDHCDWIEDFAEDHLDPKNRKKINERL